MSQSEMESSTQLLIKIYTFSYVWNLGYQSLHMARIRNSDLHLFQPWSRLNILYWNARSVVQHKTNFLIYSEIANRQGGGILFLVRNNLVLSCLRQITKQSDEIEIAGIRIENVDPVINIVACYRIPNYVLSQSSWNDVFECTDLNKNTIILEDFNAHNTKWNCLKNDINGDRLDHSINLKNLFLHNSNTSTHINSYNRKKSNIDLVFSSTSLADKISVNVKNDTFGSDHFPIEVEVDNEKYNNNPVPWWDYECNKIKRLRRASFRKWEYSGSMTDLIEYKRICALAKKLFKKKKKEHFRNFAETINFRTSKSYVWNKCKILNNSFIKAKSPDMMDKSTYNDKSTTCIQKVCPPWVATDPNWLPPCSKNSFFDDYFTFEEFNKALNSCKIKSSPGLDGIDYTILTKLPIKYKLILLDIYNGMFQSSDFPDTWIHTYIYMINKPDGNSVRPIALTSCLCKLFEKLCKNRLQWWLEHNNLIPVGQSGFRKAKSCYDNLAFLTLEIDQALSEKQNVLAAFLDVSNAFPNVLSDCLLSKLAEIKCSESLIKFVKFLTYERILHTDISDHEIKTLHKGVPQGGVLSPLLYLIYVSSITIGLPKDVEIVQFVEIVRSTQKKFPPKMYKFTRNGNAKIRINNHVIKSCETVRFLGIIFDYSMSFSHHINMIQTKCNSANIIRYLCGTWWGADPHTLLILYKSSVRSLMEYGSFIYFPTHKKLMAKIEQIQCAAVRIILGLRKTTPTNILIAESKLPFMRERACYLCYRFLAKSMSYKKNLMWGEINYFISSRKNKRLLIECIDNIFKLTEHTEVQNHLPIYDFDYKVNLISIPFDKQLGDFLKKTSDPNAVLNSFLNEHNSLNIYTDGSKMQDNRHVGVACIVPSLNIEISKAINHNASIYTAECIALNLAMDIALQHGNQEVFIFTDSLSVLESLFSTQDKANANRYILTIKEKYCRYSELTDQNKLKFFWLPSHVGIKAFGSASYIYVPDTYFKFRSAA
ncbi:uncharacterized protein LOC124413847 [Diprion similis]|uniref:uncharacterized protein LOC124413847 n=1 Tax=Diprion similis TaxID=362088 RepID=UPI001EF96238|nr:uncharacterized protein LOC124413847 [Diprion similis]